MNVNRKSPQFSCISPFPLHSERDVPSLAQLFAVRAKNVPERPCDPSSGVFVAPEMKTGAFGAKLPRDWDWESVGDVRLAKP